MEQPANRPKGDSPVHEKHSPSEHGAGGFAAPIDKTAEVVEADRPRRPRPHGGDISPHRSGAGSISALFHPNLIA